ncbi:DNA polymerase III subunit gamma and tau [Isoptericola dokdonensis]|uniref:DNA-directed DNA polymerase n=1 Tax=Isoptericola dokdonensis DS-3 TaxID=1300344 RepID=A0A161HSG9_9MICO|nr:DNA polymerase III subunit gamma and tau [Isoptericola dokdonensis]ANC32432.1 DNA polymerase III subunit tau [Isoptericola dokdonensis DS-3]
MTTALYRRYRPETFAEVIGQEHVTAPLMQALRSGRVNHAYLFSGPRGCGKTTSARILARTLNCHRNTPEQPIDTPCGECPSCVELARGGSGSLDVVEIDAASHGGVDDARDLRERATFAPTRDRYKIFVIDEAHMVSPAGFNALLKIVEEPPPHIKFVFATTEPDKVIGTIRSRTHHYPFRLLPPDVLGPYLEQLCTAEGVELGAGVTPLVTRAGGGSARDTLSVLDQLIAGATGKTVEYDTAVGLLGFTHATLLDDVVDAIAARDGGSIFRVVDHVVATGHEPRRFVEDVLERLRDLIVIAVSGDAAGAVLRDLPADQLDRMRHQAANLGVAELSRAADLVNDALTEMAGATSPRLHLELLCARLLLPGADDGTQGLAARLDRLERGAVAAGPVAPAGQAPVSAAPAGATAGVGGTGAAAAVPATPAPGVAGADGGLSGVAAARAALLASRRSTGSAGSAASAVEVPAPAPPSAGGPSGPGDGAHPDRDVEVTASAATPSNPADDAGQDPDVAPQAADGSPEVGARTAVVAAPSPHAPASTVPEQAVTGAPSTEAAAATSAQGEPEPSEPAPSVAPAAVEPEPSEPEPRTAGAADAAADASPSRPAAASDGSADGQAATAAGTPTTPSTPVGSVSAPAGTTAEDVRRRWDEVVANLTSPVTRALVDQNAQVASLTGDRLLLAFQTEPLARNFSQPRHLEAFGDALYQTLGLRAQVDVTVGAPGPGDGPAAGRQDAGSPQASTGRPPGGPVGGTGNARSGRSGGAGPDRGGRSGHHAAGDALADEDPGDPGDPWPDVPPPPDAPDAPDVADSGRGTGAGPTGATGPAPGRGAAEAADAAWLAGTPTRAVAPAAEPAPAQPPAGRSGGSASSAAPAGDRPSSGTNGPSGAGGTPSSGARAAAARAAARPTASAVPDRPAAPEPPPDPGYADGDDASDDDPDIASTGLVGVPLVVKMLDGAVIDEVVDQP